MSKIIAVFNQSGGVSKTTLTMNLGYHLAQSKQKVLLVDMDPQGSLTAFMGLEPSDLDKTVYEAIIGEEPLPIHQNIHGMDLAPANINLSGAELELVIADMRDIRLKEALEPVLTQYNFILIDCPPSLGILSYISLVAATHVLIPIQTEYKALKGTELLLTTIARVRSRANKKLKIAGVVPTMYDNRTGQGSQSLQSITNSLSKIGTIYSAIPRSVVFADAAQEHIPLALYNPKHPSVTILKQIAQSLETLP
ncbi:ParA family protein [Nostoc sp. CHAB 5784]|uniref:ParA family protein n=1 Tax=Nostoc mirabile TaxID=2907820 RepID=UPI001E29B03D|nr:ParA family protein [Nostoc mirabile]MCC5664797.1 ParA family protein [Nostoc mirabile CHAB5784]